MSLKIIAIDDEPAALNRLHKAIMKVDVDFDIHCFEDPEEALEYISAKNYRPDFAFLDIEMYGLTGIELAKEVKNLSPNTKVIFVTAHSHYALEAFSVRANGYIMKPVTPEKIAEEIAYANSIVQDVHRVKIRTFGNFEILIDGVPAIFKRSRAKEILAYLVDRHGAACSKKEIAAILWPKEEYSRQRQIYLQTLFKELMRALEENDAQQIIIRNHNSYAIDTTQIYCDCYSFEKGEIDAINAYHGEYMSNYAWAKFRIKSLNTKKNGHF